MAAYYNEIDRYAAQWLRNLIAAGHIAPGDVDERSIVDVRPDDLEGYTQCHFFAGLGGWSLALRLAGWDDTRPIWTGSCPCQPFSGAGKRAAGADERHLWPVWFRLIRECRPDGVIGEQVEGASGLGWWDRVSADLEAEGYAVGAAVLGAHSVGAPHIRQRLYWVASHNSIERRAVSGGRSRLAVREPVAVDAQQQGLSVPQYATGQDAFAQIAGGSRAGADSRSHQSQSNGQSPRQSSDRDAVGKQPQSHAVDRGGDQAEGANQMAGLPLDRQEIPMAWIVCDEGGSDCGEENRLDQGGAYYVADGATGGLADDAESGRRAQPERAGVEDGRTAAQSGRLRGTGGLADGDGQGRGQRPQRDGQQVAGIEASRGHDAVRCSETGFWSDHALVPCSDGKARRTEPSIQPLAHAGEWGTGSRVGILRAAGNAIVPALAAAFIQAACAAIGRDPTGL